MPGKTVPVYLQGKCKWARLVQPDLKFNKWSLVLYPDAASYDILVDLVKKGIKNKLKQDADGWYVTLSRATQKVMQGKVRAFERPEVLDGTKPLPSGGYEPFIEASKIGNGSDVTVKIEHYTYHQPTDPQGTFGGHAIKLASVRVDNFVPYEMDRDGSEEQKKLVEGMEEVPPQPLF